MFLYPDGYFDSVRDIRIEYLKENEIKAVILDVDNTLIDYYKNFQDGTKEWVEEAKKNGIKFSIGLFIFVIIISFSIIGFTNIENILHLLAPKISVIIWSPTTAMYFSSIFNNFFAFLNPPFNGFLAK